MSRLDLIVGPDGAGKTTLFERVTAPDRPGLPFVNADRIAADRWPGEERERSYEAAQVAAAARHALIDARLDFCAETVVSHPSKLRRAASATSPNSRKSWSQRYPHAVESRTATPNAAPLGHA